MGGDCCWLGCCRGYSVIAPVLGSIEYIFGCFGAAAVVEVASGDEVAPDSAALALFGASIT